MRYALFLILMMMGSVAGCSTSQATQTQASAVDPTADIDRAVRDFAKDRDIRGITLHKQTDTFYLVGVDADSRPGESSFSNTLVVRRFETAGKSYWKAEQYLPLIHDHLKPDANSAQ